MFLTKKLADYHFVPIRRGSPAAETKLVLSSSAPSRDRLFEGLWKAVRGRCILFGPSAISDRGVDGPLVPGVRPSASLSPVTTIERLGRIPSRQYVEMLTIDMHSCGAVCSGCHG